MIHFKNIGELVSSKEGGYVIVGNKSSISRGQLYLVKIECWLSGHSLSFEDTYKSGLSTGCQGSWGVVKRVPENLGLGLWSRRVIVWTMLVILPIIISRF